jgi:NOL1/NOP2/sun family putative RNA methylase
VALSVRGARSRLPGEFVDELYRAFPIHDADRILRGLTRRRPVTLRANTLKSSIGEVLNELRRSGAQCQRVPWYPDALVIKNLRERDIEPLPLYSEGKVYLQSLSSMIPPLVLDPKPGDAVLDIAAAPGSKTTQMAALMNNEGRIVAAEIDRVRADRLVFNLERQGVRIAEVVVRDGVTVADDYPEHFDRVLVDAPCSGEGLFIVDDPSTYRPWSKKVCKHCIASQRRLLEAGARALKPGGRMVYSTCTLNPEENELLVDDFLLLQSGKFTTVPMQLDVPQWSPPLDQVKGRVLASELKHTRRVFPSQLMEGFYIALLRRRPEREM